MIKRLYIWYIERKYNVHIQKNHDDKYKTHYTSYTGTRTVMLTHTLTETYAKLKENEDKRKGKE